MNSEQSECSLGGVTEQDRDSITGIRFSIGGFPEGYTYITIEKEEDGALVRVQQMPIRGDSIDDRRIPLPEWQELVDALYSRLYLHEWKDKYVDPHILDGTQWHLDIILTGDRTISYLGCNAYPPQWGELSEILGNIAGKPDVIIC